YPGCECLITFTGDGFIPADKLLIIVGISNIKCFVFYDCLTSSLTLLKTFSSISGFISSYHLFQIIY
ncbi:hypothetical protein, partial [Intestinibacter bartlettii]|uniref:hypothetical protein n=1 Tax=Intestinibacter bartlettii TaxID=261299 RepID=UPI003994BC86